MDYHGKGSALKPKQTQETLPASQYLQDRLQERRARNTRPKRTRQSDFGPRVNAGHDDDLFFAEAEDGRRASTRAYDSSPLAPFAKYGADLNASQAGGTLSAGGRKRRTPGARELDEQMDRLTKQNFDLKLELDHRRENQAKLHAELESMRDTVERAERLEDEHEELMRINSLLVEELEKRDKAIQEAADIICELEEKVEDYEERTATETRPSTAHADSGYAGTETHEQMPPSSPPQVVANSRHLQAATATAKLSSSNPKLDTTQAPSRPRREPAFLTSQKPSNQALRAVYLGAGKDLHPVSSFNSILSKRTSTIDTAALADEVLNSPRLSALSESSFPSIYGKNTPEKHEWEELPESAAPYGSAHSRQDSISRVNRWIEDRQGLDGTPSKSNRISSPVPTASMLPTPGLLRKSAESSLASLSSAAASARLAVLDGQGAVGGKARNAPKTPAVFGEPLLLPTPESSGTKRPRSSRSSAAGERSLLDVTPAPVKSFTPLEPRTGASQRRGEGPVEVKDSYLDRQHGNSRPAQTSFVQTNYDDDSDSEHEYDDYDGHSDTLRDFGPSYNDDYPDGASITNGTPSRFLKTRSPSAAGTTDMFFAASSSLSPTSLGLSTPTAQRRKSSAEVYTPTATAAVKPSLLRAETSPTVYATPASGAQYLSASASNNSNSGGRPSTSSSTASPQSYTSASTTIHFAAPEQTQPTHGYARSTSPAPIRPSPAPPRSSFTQRTQSLFRRLSSGTASSFSLSMSEVEPQSQSQTQSQIQSQSQSQSKRREREREREKSPLPTLTSTPSSAYARAERDSKAARELRFEREWEGRGLAGGFGARAGREIQRPSTSASMIRPGMVGGRSGTGTGTDDEGEGFGGGGFGRKGWLRRAGSGRERDVGLRRR